MNVLNTKFSPHFGPAQEVQKPQAIQEFDMWEHSLPVELL